MKTLLSASILNADFSNLTALLHDLEQWGVDMVHFDVMDGVFVDNITFGMPICETVHRNTYLFLDAHLMIANPTKYIPGFVKAGADMITIHLESSGNTAENLNLIRKSGVRAGLAIKPATPVEEVYPYLHMLDVVLVMSVEPGFGGQGFLPESLDKIRTLRAYLDEHAPQVEIQVDGGINAETGASVRAAGANQLVSGNYLFHAEHFSSAVKCLRGET